MTKFNIGQLVYRRTINHNVLSAWKVVAIRRSWFTNEYYLQSTVGSFLVIEKERNLFAVPKSA